MKIVIKNGVVGRYIFRTSMKTKDGRIIYAKDYGKKAFRIFIPL